MAFGTAEAPTAMKHDDPWSVRAAATLAPIRLRSPSRPMGPPESPALRWAARP